MVLTDLIAELIAIVNLMYNSLMDWINTYFKLPEEMHVDKASELVHNVKDWVDEEYAGGRVTVLTDEEIVACINRICLENDMTMEQYIAAGKQ